MRIRSLFSEEEISYCSHKLISAIERKKQVCWKLLNCSCKGKSTFSSEQNTPVLLLYCSVTKSNVANELSPICAITVQAKCMKHGKGNICLRSPYSESQIDWNLRLNSSWRAAEHKGKRDLLSAAGLGGRDRRKKNIKGIFYEHLAPGRGTSHLLMSAAFSCPNLPKKNKGKALQQAHRKRKPNVSWVWNKLIGHRTPHIPDQEEILQAYKKVQMTQRALEKKCTNTKHVERHLHAQFLLEWHFLPHLDEILFELPKHDRFWIAKANKKWSYFEKVFSGHTTEKKTPNNLKLKKGIWWMMWTQQGKTSAWISLDWNMPFWKYYNFLFCTHAKQLILKYSSLQ